jgi:hypothetical protein
VDDYGSSDLLGKYSCMEKLLLRECVVGRVEE